MKDNQNGLIKTYQFLLMRNAISASASKLMIMKITCMFIIASNANIASSAWIITVHSLTDVQVKVLSNNSYSSCFTSTFSHLFCYTLLTATLTRTTCGISRIQSLTDP